jgi:hypothetical protein
VAMTATVPRLAPAPSGDREAAAPCGAAFDTRD